MIFLYSHFELTMHQQFYFKFEFKHYCFTFILLFLDSIVQHCIWLNYMQSLFSFVKLAVELAWSYHVLAERLVEEKLHSMSSLVISLLLLKRFDFIKKMAC